MRPDSFISASSPETSMAGWNNAVMRHISSSPGPDRRKTIMSAVGVERLLKMAC
jgi:hypothetical protein